VVVRTIHNSLGGCSVIFQFFIFLINWFDMSSAQSKRDPFLDPGEKALPKEEVEFILIGAGLPRTGTLSTFTALEMLLPGNCHHMARVVRDKTTRNSNFWPKAIRGEATREEWRHFVRDERLSAGVDFPTALFWRDLLDIYPNAKVLFTDRDPVRWYESSKNTISKLYKLITSPAITINPLCQLVMRLTDQAVMLPNLWTMPVIKDLFGAIEDGQEQAVEFYQAWRAQVVKEVPAERLLIWQVKDGWEPLCEFLCVPVPETPFPNVNDTAMFQKRLNGMRRTVWTTWAATVGLISFSVYWLL